MEAFDVEPSELSDRLRPLNGAPSALMLPLIAPLQAPAEMMQMIHRSMSNVFWSVSPLRFAPAPALAMMRAFTPPMLAAAIPGLAARRGARPSAAVASPAAAGAARAAPMVDRIREQAALYAPKTAPAR